MRQYVYIHFQWRIQNFLVDHRSWDTAPLLWRDTARSRQQLQDTVKLDPDPSRVWLLDHLLYRTSMQDQDICTPTFPPIPFPSRIGFTSSVQAPEKVFNSPLNLGWLPPSSGFPASPWGAGFSDHCWDVVTCPILLSLQADPVVSRQKWSPVPMRVLQDTVLTDHSIIVNKSKKPKQTPKNPPRNTGHYRTPDKPVSHTL